MILEREKIHTSSRGFATPLLLTGAFVVVLALVGVGYRSVSTLKNYWQERIAEKKEIRAALKDQRNLLKDAQEKIKELGAEFEGIKKKTGEDTTGIIEKIEDEKKRTARTERARVQGEAETQKRISALADDVVKSKPIDLATLIKKWRVRVAHIDCVWRFSNGTVAEKTGSGFLFGSTMITTNKHVVDYEGVSPGKCAITLPGDPNHVEITAGGTGGWIATSQEDFALIQVSSPTPFMRTLHQEGAQSAVFDALSCKRRGVAGDEIVVLGYPRIGAEKDVTATEGILSGYEGSYYITSAKLERGNSGGATILVKDDCYLGIPAFVRAGDLESLGRILDFAKVKPR